MNELKIDRELLGQIAKAIIGNSCVSDLLQEAVADLLAAPAEQAADDHLRDAAKMVVVKRYFVELYKDAPELHEVVMASAYDTAIDEHRRCYGLLAAERDQLRADRDDFSRSAIGWKQKAEEALSAPNNELGRAMQLSDHISPWLYSVGPIPQELNRLWLDWVERGTVPSAKELRAALLTDKRKAATEPSLADQEYGGR